MCLNFNNFIFPLIILSRLNAITRCDSKLKFIDIQGNLWMVELISSVLWCKPNYTSYLKGNVKNVMHNPHQKWPLAWRHWTLDQGVHVHLSYVGWVCCWFSSLLWEVFPRVLRFSPLLKNQHFQIPILAWKVSLISARALEDIDTKIK